MLYIQRKIRESISINGDTASSITVLKLLPREVSILLRGPPFKEGYEVRTVRVDDRSPFLFNVGRDVVSVRLMKVERGTVRFGIEAPKNIIIKSVDESQEDHP